MDFLSADGLMLGEVRGAMLGWSFGGPTLVSLALLSLIDDYSL